MRREILKGRKIAIGIAASAVPFFLLLYAAPASAQVVESSILEQMAESASGEGLNEELEAHLEQFLRHPIDMNNAGRQRLESSGLFSLFQIESLLEYRKEFGEVLSLQELAFVDGFSQSLVESLSPYITLGAIESPGRPLNKALLRYKNSYGGGKGAFYSRYSGEGASYSWGFTARAGSSPVSSAFVRHEGKHLDLLLGDLSPRFGQGLVLWNGFSMTALASPSSALKRQNGIVPSRSPSTFGLRGVGVNLSLEPSWSASLVAATSLLSANVNWSGEWLRVGATALRGSSKEKYANFSVDAIASLGHLRLFGEVAWGGSVAVVAGAVWNPSYSFEASMLLRHYPASFVAPSAAAFSSLSSRSNQSGAALFLNLRLGGGLLLKESLDAVYHPEPRYRVPVPSAVVKNSLGIERDAIAFHPYARWDYRFDSYGVKHKNTVRIGAKWSPLRWLRLQTGVYAVALFEYDTGLSGYHLYKGAAAFQEMLFCPGKGVFEASLRVTAYSTDNYDTRIYIYERDLPGYFSVPMHYGRGIKAYATLRYRPSRKMSFSAKFSLQEGRIQMDLSL